MWGEAVMNAQSPGVRSKFIGIEFVLISSRICMDPVKDDNAEGGGNDCGISVAFVVISRC